MASRGSKFIWAGLLALLGIGLYFLFRALGAGSSAGHILADLTSEWHRRDVTEKRAELGQLHSEIDKNIPRIAELNREIEVKRARLAGKYEAAGLTRDEAMEKLRAIQL